MPDPERLVSGDNRFDSCNLDSNVSVEPLINSYCMIHLLTPKDDYGTADGVAVLLSSINVLE